MMRLRRRGRVGLALLVPALLLAACAGEPKRETFAGAPVVLVSIDTLRSDRLPAYGYTEVETPALDAFRAEAILFERAYSHYPITFPSHASILTGLLPSQHGVRDNVGYRLDTAVLPYLPKELKAAGYATGAAVSAFVLQGGQGLEDSFDFYQDSIETRRDVPLGGLQRSGMETLERALPWLDEAAGGPFFFFFHLYEPHTPYTPPEPYASRYASPYDGEVAFTDRILERLFGELRQRGVYDEAIILILSDHGEGLGDHGEQEHGIYLYRESIQVPLLLKLPGGRHGGDAVSSPAQLIDVAPTVLALLGLDVPDRLPGLPLLDLLGEGVDRPIYAETYYPRLHMGWSDLASLIQGGFHYIEGPEPELYNLESDPAELHNVILDQRRIFAGLRDDLKPLRAPLERPGEVDPETLRKLSALGYAGSPTTAEGPLPDPKTRIHSLEDLKVASRLMGRKEWGRAIPLLQRMVEENPRMQDAWEKLALSLHRAGRRNEAVAAYQQALENSGGTAQVALALAALYLELGQYDEARTHAEIALPTAPSLAHQRLAEIAFAAEDLSAAEEEARKAVEEDPDRPGARITLAQVLGRRGRVEEGMAMLESAEELLASSGDSTPPGLYLARGDLLARRGQAAEAVQAFEEEIRRNPEILDAYARLAILHVTQGRPGEAWETLQRMVEANGGSPAAYVSAVETLRILGDPRAAAQLLAAARNRYPGDRRLQELAQAG